MNVSLRRMSGEDVSAQPVGGAGPGGEAERRDIAALMAVMLRLIDQQGAIVVYFTAVSHGEGTSTVARELAVTAARSAWCKVVLIDANPGATVGGAPAAPFGLLEAPPGSEALALCRSWYGEAELLEGVLSGARGTLASVEAVRGLFARLRTQFTLVVVDGPPLASARQAAAFSAAADHVVLVVEAERTRASDLERARATLEQLGAHVLGIVLNKRRSWVPGRLSRLLWGAAP